MALEALGMPADGVDAVVDWRAAHGPPSSRAGRLVISTINFGWRTEAVESFVVVDLA